MEKKMILVVEDEESISELICFNLQKEGYSAASALSAEEALRKIQLHTPNLILLDIMLPGMDGLELCRRLKKNPVAGTIPIVMLTAKGTEADIVTGLELGADDYMVKPFSPRVLMAKIKAVLRRKLLQNSADSSPVRIHDLEIDPLRHSVCFKGNPVSLTPGEFRALHFLSMHPGWVYTRSQLVEAIRGGDYTVTDRAVDVLMVGLRKKLGGQANLVETVRGVGYRFKE
jgi:two-component system phosphate regulon response regulator PhoB